MLTSAFKHAAVSDTFIVIISERAPLEMAYISMSPKVICGRTVRERSDQVGVPPSQCKDNLHLEPEKKVSDGAKMTRI